MSPSRRQQQILDQGVADIAYLSKIEDVIEDDGLRAFVGRGHLRAVRLLPARRVVTQSEDFGRCLRRQRRDLALDADRTRSACA